MSLLGLSIAVLAGLWALVSILRPDDAPAPRAALVVAMAIAAIAFGAARPTTSPPPDDAPRVLPAAGYVGSGACASCHPSEYASWSKTFHRTMTQRADKATVLAPLETAIEAEGIRYTLSADTDGAVWVRADPGALDRVLITTGSHHMQGYWVTAGRGALRMLPFVFAREDRKVIARRDAFVEPPGVPQRDVRWNSNCIACHATAGQPRATSDHLHYETSVTELGIACEACHGPGGSHVERHHDPIERFALRRGAATDPTIVNPARLPADKASAVCGQCHSYSYPSDERGFWRSGYVESFRPGQELAPSRVVLSPAVLADPEGPKVDVEVDDLFWPDGTVRVAGREYNAMILSACFLRGEGPRKIACGSCHSMHESDPDDMLRRDRSVQRACVSCHSMPEDHSRHAPGSPGDACVACHMPKTSYALRTAIRSHRIDVPDSRGLAGEPNACNLCHLDQSRAWVATALARRRGTSDGGPPPPGTPESAMGLLTGDAAERVLWADAMGDADALAASGAGWEARLLTYAADHDPYAVVRYVAARSRSQVATTTQREPPYAVEVGDDQITALARIRDDRDVTVAE
ncbi:MAG TPA: multiheme c-type cytochrome [Polyangiaceae bacterium]|nr:multiheme c-type cytochrome [Polyangiaceae bacterium]